jgi:phosphoglucomutase
MSTGLSPLAGQPATAVPLLDVPRLLAAYADLRPDPEVAAQRVAFGTSGHRGSAMTRSFNEWHVLAISQAICEHRRDQGIDGPLHIGFDTHALSRPAFDSALQVFAANGVDVLIARDDEFTPTPVISRAILVHNRERGARRTDGIVITPSHNPPQDGGFKYNPPHGGPAGTAVTAWIQDRANALIYGGLRDVRRIALARARRAVTTHERDFLAGYVDDLGQVLDLAAIRAAGLRIAVDPMGGAGVHYWARIAERYDLDLTILNQTVDPTFAFMTLDWDGRVRMDPSSPYAMKSLIAQKDRYDIGFASDTDHDRHGIVAPGTGLMPSNHFLCVAIDYLYRHRPAWGPASAIGKSAVSSATIDRVAARLGRRLFEVPVGFKWFVDGLLDGALGFAGEESAGASFSRIDGSAWTTDKDGIVPALLSAEITARLGRHPGELYECLAGELGAAVADRIEAPANAAQRARLARLSPAQVASPELAGEPIESIRDRAAGNDAPLGGIKVIAAGGWFAARPSGTEDIYKIYAESFRGEDHLRAILQQAQQIVDAALAQP